MVCCCVVQLAKVGPRPPRCEVSRSQVIIHTNTQTRTHAHAVGLLQTTAHPVAEAPSYATRTKYNTRIFMLSMGFDPAIPAIAELLLTPHGL